MEDVNGGLWALVPICRRKKAKLRVYGGKIGDLDDLGKNKLGFWEEFGRIGKNLGEIEYKIKDRDGFRAHTKLI